MTVEKGPEAARPALRHVHEVLVLVAILAVAAVLRFHRLDREGLWLDEAGTASYAVMPLGGLVARAAAQDVHPPLYYVLLHFWVGAFGAGEAGLRSFSAVLGLLGVVAVWRCGRAWATPFVGLAAAALLACTPYHIYYSQEARSYVLLALAATASFACLARLLQAPDRRAAALYTLATAALVYTHVYAFFVVAAQAVVALGAPGRREGWPGRRGWLVCGAAVALLFVPQVLTAFRQADQFQGGGTTWIARPQLPELLMTLVQFAGTPGAFALVGPLALLPLVWHARGRADGPAVVPGFGFALALWFWLPILVPLAISQVRAPIFLTRGAICGLPALSLAAAWGFALLRPRALKVAAAAAVIGVLLVAQSRFFQVRSKEQWREAVAGIERQAAAGDAVVLDALHGRQGYAYYERRTDLRVADAAHDLASARGPEALAGVAGGRVFVVRFQRREDHDGVARALPGYRLTGFHRYHGILVYRFERP